MNNIDYGKQGESIAIKYLKKNNYKIIEHNYRTSIGEIDIIAEKDKAIVFIEVKARYNQNFGLPREAVNFFKQKKYSSMAIQYIKKNQLFNVSCRFDVIEVLNGKVNHITDAFEYIK